MGDYTCQEVAAARTAIEAASLVVGTVTPSPPASDDLWHVQAQDPIAGTMVPPGSAVDLTVIEPALPCVTPAPSPSPTP